MVRVLRESRADVLVCYMPVGSEDAVRYYAQACLDAGAAMVNCVPVFIASHPEWAGQFRRKQLPIVGDDIKSQFGATIIHRMLARLMGDRGVQL
ncbi:MAG: inositol-3-phosphate synthase, partial [Planctomycetota bacterium]